MISQSPVTGGTAAQKPAAPALVLLILKLADPDSCCRGPTGTSIAKTYGSQWDIGAALGADDGADESTSPQVGITPKEGARVLKVSLSWLAKARMRGDGPPYIRIGRSIRYTEAALIQWMKSRQRLSTSEQ